MAPIRRVSVSLALSDITICGGPSERHHPSMTTGVVAVMYDFGVPQTDDCFLPRARSMVVMISTRLSILKCYVDVHSSPGAADVGSDG